MLVVGVPTMFTEVASGGPVWTASAGATDVQVARDGQNARVTLPQASLLTTNVGQWTGFSWPVPDSTPVLGVRVRLRHALSETGPATTTATPLFAIDIGGGFHFLTTTPLSDALGYVYDTYNKPRGFPAWWTTPSTVADFSSAQLQGNYTPNQVPNPGALLVDHVEWGLYVPDECVRPMMSPRNRLEPRGQLCRP